MGAHVRVLVYSSSAVVRAGIESALGNPAAGGRNGTVLASVGSHRDLPGRVASFAPDAVVLHGLDRTATTSLAGHPGPTVVLAVGDSACGADILHAVRVGITSIVSVDTDLSALPQACRGAVAGIPYLSPALLRTLLRYMSGNESPDTRASSRLTARETQILRHLTVGSSQSDISVQLRISSRTVKYHLGNLYQKLGVHSQAEAIVRAHRDGLVT